MKAKGGVPLSGAELLAIVQEDIDPVVQTLVDTASTIVISKSPIATQPVVKATITKVKPTQTWPSPRPNPHFSGSIGNTARRKL